METYMFCLVLWLIVGQMFYNIAIARRVYQLHKLVKKRNPENIPPKGAFLKGTLAIFLGPLVYFLIE